MKAMVLERISGIESAPLELRERPVPEAGGPYAGTEGGRTSCRQDDLDPRVAALQDMEQCDAAGVRRRSDVD